MQLLLDRGAQLNIVDQEGLTPLSYATEKGYMDIINILKENGGTE